MNVLRTIAVAVCLNISPSHANNDTALCSPLRATGILAYGGATMAIAHDIRTRYNQGTMSTAQTIKESALFVGSGAIGTGLLAVETFNNCSNYLSKDVASLCCIAPVLVGYPYGLRKLAQGMDDFLLRNNIRRSIGHITDGAGSFLFTISASLLAIRAIETNVSFEANPLDLNDNCQNYPYLDASALLGITSGLALMKLGKYITKDY